MHPAADEENSRTIWRAELLSTDHVPHRLAGREEQKRTLGVCLSPVSRGEAPLNAWLWGPPGTGKTALARSMAREACGGSSRLAVYVNCWERRSVYSVVQSMVESLRILGAEAQDTNVKMDRIRQVVKDRPVAIVLDDVDRVAPGERDRIIEALLALPRAGLVCISDRKDALLELDERIRSRLSPTLIRFPPYAAKEVEEILQDRARRALLPDCWSRQALRTLADGAGGDARAAIQGLRLAAVTAEDQRRKNVSSAELPGPVSATVETRQERATRQLSYHQRLIYELARERQPVPTSKLRRAYASKCAASGVTPVARRTFSKYVRALRDADLISVDDRCVGGSGRLIRLTATRSETGRARGPSAASRGSAP